VINTISFRSATPGQHKEMAAESAALLQAMCRITLQLRDLSRQASTSSLSVQMKRDIVSAILSAGASLNGVAQVMGAELKAIDRQYSNQSMDS
jgi:hypothetical protein